MTSEAIIVSGGETDNLIKLIGVQCENQKIVGVDGGAIRLLEAGISVDVAIGDFDSISKEQLENLKMRIPKVIELPAEKDLTDTEAALEFVSEHYQVDVIKMLGLLGGRVDHMMSNIWLAYQPKYRPLLTQIQILDRNNTLTYFEPGKYEISKEENKKYISFIGMTPIKNLKLVHAKYPLQGDDFTYPIALVSNEFLENTIKFSFDEGIMAVIQSKD